MKNFSCTILFVDSRTREVITKEITYRAIDSKAATQGIEQYLEDNKTMENGIILSLIEY